MRKSIFEGIMSGIYVGVGATVYLSCENKIIGSVAFTIALISICLTGAQLFTGKVGYMVFSHKKSDFISLIGCIIGNAIGTFTCAAIGFGAGLPIRQRAIEMCAAKLDTPYLKIFFAAIMCGILMFTAVYTYKEKNSMAAVFFAVPAFILSGYEHSIADMFYFSASMKFSLEILPFLGIVLLGNSVGGMLIPALMKLAGNKNP